MGRQEQLATLRYINPQKSAELAISNIWLDDGGGPHVHEPDRRELVQAWRGILIEDPGHNILVRCSGNYDGPDFNDLAARITLHAGARGGK